MSDATLPDCLVVYLGPGRGLHYSLGSRVGTALVQREVGATLSLYAVDHIEAQAERVRVLEGEVTRLKTVPMKYRRMEFNAQLQHENATLTERIRVLRDALEKLTACKAVEIRLRQLHEMGHGTDYDQHRQRNWEGCAMRYEDIKAELRRSACEDKYPYLDVKQEAIDYAFTWTDSRVYRDHMPDDIRTFFLLVAEAMVYADT